METKMLETLNALEALAAEAAEQARYLTDLHPDERGGRAYYDRALARSQILSKAAHAALRIYQAASGLATPSGGLFQLVRELAECSGREFPDGLRPCDMKTPGQSY